MYVCPFKQKKKKKPNPKPNKQLLEINEQSFVINYFHHIHRRKSTIQKYDPPYLKKPTEKTYSSSSGNHHPENAALDNVNKILSFGTMPTYR